MEDKPQFALTAGRLQLSAQPDKGGAALGRSMRAANYEATTTLLNPAALPTGTTAGLAALGDPDNSLSLLAGEGKLRLQERRAGQNRVLAETVLPATTTLWLRMQVQGGDRYRFARNADGRTWTPMQPANETANGQFLPPWDWSVRVGLLLGRTQFQAGLFPHAEPVFGGRVKGFARLEDRAGKLGRLGESGKCWVSRQKP